MEYKLCNDAKIPEEACKNISPSKENINMKRQPDWFVETKWPQKAIENPSTAKKNIIIQY